MIKKLVFGLVLMISLLINILLGFVYRSNVFGDNNLESDKKTEVIEEESTNDLTYHDVSNFEILGKYHNEEGYSRLPKRFAEKVRPKVWKLSENSSGLQIRFSTNSSKISARWTLSKESSQATMTSIGESGVDLYCFQDSVWQFVNSGIPKSVVNDYTLITEMDSTSKDFLLHFPLYNSVQKLEIGIDKSAGLKNISRQKRGKPIVFYGTSITQGKSASRPGMAYPSIISRSLDIETINLGFSGNGKFEKEVGDALCEIDAQLFVIDCTPNSSPEIIQSNAVNLIVQIRTCKPHAPILLVESIIREYAYFRKSDETVFGGLSYINRQNHALSTAYNQAKENGIEGLYYLENNGLIGYDHEATIDGTHLTDLGMVRIAEKIEDKIIDILSL